VIENVRMYLRTIQIIRSTRENPIRTTTILRDVVSIPSQISMNSTIIITEPILMTIEYISRSMSRRSDKCGKKTRERKNPGMNNTSKNPNMTLNNSETNVMISAIFQYHKPDR
jgi:hypothetical protein